MSFNCEICKYHTSRKDNFLRHLKSKSHQEKFIINPSPLLNQKIEKEKKFICNRCQKKFTYNSGLSRHKKICFDMGDEKIKEIFQTLPCALYEFKCDGIVMTPTYISESIRELYNLENIDVKKNWKIIWTLMHPDDKDSILASFKLAISNTKNPQPYFKEVRFVVNGQIKWVWMQSYPKKQKDGIVLWHGQDTDITFSKLVSPIKPFSSDVHNKKIKEIFKTLPCALYEFKCDGSNIMPTYISPSIRELYNLEDIDIINNWRIISSLVHPDDKEHILTDFNLAMSNIKNPQPYFKEVRFIVNNHIKWIWMQSYPTKLEDGNILWRGQDTDITFSKSLCQSKTPQPLPTPSTH